MTIECPKCHYENPDETAFCGKCGTKFDSDVGPTKTLEIPAGELKRGSVFAERYEIIEELGKGGMGKVYRVEDKKAKEEIALKLIKPEIAADKKTIERFRNELTTARKIAHRNVCKMFDLGEKKGSYFIMMEYVLGEDLKSFIRRSRQLSIPSAISIAKQVCDGLSEAHRVGVIHRDLKPSNIMIDKDGDAKIMDFGIARSVESKGITGAGVMIGTPEYMSPEQVEAKEVDRRSDIYSLGIIMYEMLTGRLPFEGDTPLSIAMKHKGEIPKDPREFNAQISENISRLILRCLEKDKKNRYQSADEIRSALEDVERGIPATEKVKPPRKSITSKEITVTFRKPWIMIAALVVLAVVIGVAILIFKGENQVVSPARKRLAVLPFKNLGPTEDEYFADSITEEIRVKLTQIETLGMIARTSAYQYKNITKSIREIGQELEADYILDGTIRWQRSPDGPSQVRVTPELIRASDSTSLWTEVYDRDITDIFEVQSAIAEQVADALDITLADDERRALRTRPTANMDAYNSYLRGVDYLNRSNEEENVRISIQMFERAIELDPDFALAYARLARSYAFLYWGYYFEVDESLLVNAKEALDKADELSPDSPETHLASGYYYYYGHMDYERALEHFYQAQKTLKNDSEVLVGIGFIQRRQGDLDQAAVNLKKAFFLDPRSTVKASELGVTYFRMRNYSESERYFNIALSLSPDDAKTYSFIIRLYLAGEGGIKKAFEAIEQAPQTVHLSDYFVIASMLVHAIGRNYQEMLDSLSLFPNDFVHTHHYFVPKSLLYAQIYGLMNEFELEKEHYESARSFLEAKVQEWPKDARLHSSLGIVYAGLARKEEAIREGKTAVELLPVSRDAWRGALPRLGFSHHLCDGG